MGNNTSKAIEAITGCVVLVALVVGGIFCVWDNWFAWMVLGGITLLVVLCLSCSPKVCGVCGSELRRGESAWMQDGGETDEYKAMKDGDLEYATEAVDRAGVLAKQLMRLGKNGSTPMEQLDVNQMILDIKNMLMHLGGEKVRVMTSLQPRLNHITGNKAELDEIILNLTTNACAAMPEGGELKINTACVDVSDRVICEKLEITAGNYIVMSFSDEGCGIDSSVMPHIFEPYFTTNEKGTGLGLSTVYTLVKKNFGSINIDSEMGKGTTFDVYFPVSEQRQSEVEQPVEVSQVDTDNKDGKEAITSTISDPELEGYLRDILQLWERANPYAEPRPAFTREYIQKQLLFIQTKKEVKQSVESA